MPRYMREAEADAGAPDAGVGQTDAGVPLPGGVPEAEAAAPTGPNACATQEEEERKERFRRRSLSATDFRPAAGYGKFDAYYWPFMSLMSAIVKMKFNFLEAEDTPDIPTLFSMVLAGQDISVYFWTDGEKRQYERDYVQTVSQQWSFQHTFRSTKPCWPFIAVPYVTPHIVNDASDAHFNVSVFKMSSATGKRTSSFRARNPGTAGWQGTGELDENDVIEEQDKRSRDVARSERRRLERAIAAAGASPVLFSHNRSDIQPPFGARLTALAEAMKAKNPSDPAIPLILRGFASAEGPRARNDRLSRERAEATAEELRRTGVPQSLIVDPQGPVGAPNDATNRKVELVPDSGFETGYTGNRFSPAAHEFGHAIGLPDEYVNRTTGNLGAKQTAFVNLARQAGVSPPDRWGDRTASVMSVGVDVLPRHYLTIWEALGQMTSPDIVRNEWSLG
ncbi:MAG: OmpA family protein [Gammaproteobacteria bacterium]|nr:OmpA family protein [Gammaproteobacteria bacterium]